MARNSKKKRKQIQCRVKINDRHFGDTNFEFVASVLIDLIDLRCSCPFLSLSLYLSAPTNNICPERENRNKSIVYLVDAAPNRQHLSARNEP